MINTELQKDDCGLYFYENPPSNFVLAQPEDFFNKVEVLDDDGDFLKFNLVLKKNHAYLVHSYYNPVYWANRTHEDFDIKNLNPFFSDNRVYIWKTDL